MKNLKQVLALGMAFSLTMSTMAGAAFTDQADIKATEAVNMLAALGVIDGYEDGSFKPEGTVTRAEAAKMIYTIRNGGNSDASAWAGLSTSFTDLTGYGWAEGYIKYCQSMGIISGKSATQFDPGAPVTGVELAKMMLVTLGYNPETAGLEGATWSNKTLALAGENALLDDVNADLSAGLPRQYAAQLLYNAVLAPTVVLRDGSYTTKDLLGNDNDTIGEKYMGLIETEVTLNGDDKLVSGLNDSETQVYVLETVNGVVGSGNKTITYTVENIESKIGENFNLLWKDTNGSKDLDKNDKVYGMYSSNTTTVLNVTADDIEAGASGKVKIAGTEYKVAESGSIYKNYGAETGSTWPNSSSTGESAIEKLEATTGDKVRVILNDNNEISAVYVISAKLYKVTAVSGTKVSVAGIGTIDTSKNDTVVYDGIAKDDVVAVTQLYNSTTDDATFVIEKAESVTGTLTAYSGTKSITLDGTVYNVYNKQTLTKLTDDAITTVDSDLIDTTVTLYLVNGYVYAAQKTTEEANLYAIVNAVNDGKLGSTFETPQAELILADGTKKTVTLHKDSKLYNETGHGTSGTPIDGTVAINDKDVLEKGSIVKYVEMSNGEYKVEEVGTYGTSATETLYDSDTKTFKGVVTSGDCVLFYTNAEGELKATTIRSLDDIDVASGVTYATVEKDGKVISAYIDLKSKPSGVSDATLYGIVTSDATTTSKDGDTYNMYTIATNEGDVSVYLPTDEYLTKGDIVSFDKSSDDIYNKATEFTVYNGTDTGMAVAVTEYNDADKTISYATSMKLEGGAYVAETVTTKAVDSDVKISYINADDNKAGDSGFGVNEYDAVTGYANAILVFDGDKVIAIIVNTNGDTDVMGNKTPACLEEEAEANVTDVQAALDGDATSVVVDALTVNADLTVPAGKTLTVNGNLVVSASKARAVVAGLTVNGTLIVKGTVTIEADATVTVAEDALMAATGAVTNNGGVISGTINENTAADGTGGNVYGVDADTEATKVTL